MKCDERNVRDQFAIARARKFDISATGNIAGNSILFALGYKAKMDFLELEKA